MRTSPADRGDPGAAAGRVVTAHAERLLDEMRAVWRGYDLPLLEEGRAGLELDTGQGRIRLDAERAGLAIRIEARSATDAAVLCEALAARMAEFDPALLDVLSWSDGGPTPGLPPNFRAGRVRRVAPLGALFWRLTIEAENLHPFARDGLHLRLALPPPGRRAVWPRIDGTGRTRWPDGPDMLHVAVYTIREIDPDAGTMTIDAFRHKRGSACAWLAAARPGDPVGLLGPGGGWLPSARHLTLAGDETALPAIARILGAAAPVTTGTALLEAERAGELPPVAAPAGVALRALARAEGQSLEAEIERAELGPEGDRHVWFAAEARRARQMRATLAQARGVSRQERYVAAYWTDR